ncbi:MAG: tRNA (N(6)-L-threonylcarbamoyladenosine(37)-C(2))-methylthiotransferase MtaB [Pseudomonadota bacterium]
MSAARTAPETPRPQVVTFGCRLNIYESEVIGRLAGAAGLGSAVVVNTCAVTAEAERQARQAIRRLKRDRPEAQIIVTGCAAQLRPASFADMPEVTRVLGNAEKRDPAAWRAVAQDPEAPRVAVADILAVRETAGHLIAGFNDRTRAFLEVQQGCDHRCTFCVIPLARGPSRSVPPGELVANLRAVVEGGVNEVVLTGVDLTAYGGDLPGRIGLGGMVRRLLAAVPALPRLRLSSLDPAEIDDDLWRLLADEERLMPHLHLSLQSGDDLILKRMKRRHDRAQALEVCQRARALRPGIALGADLIAGFPTETEDMFAHTLSLVEAAGLASLHVFAYSRRPGTAAAKMPPVPGPAIASRARRLREEGARAQARFLAGRVGQRASVLVENSGLTGHSEHFAPVALDRPASAGTIVAVDILALGGDRLLGRVA